MFDSDLPAFQARLDAVCSMLSRGRYVPDPVACAVFFRALAAHPLGDVLAAFDAHVSDPDRGRFPPLPADILAQLVRHAADDGRPGPQEAWALAMRASDEADTIIWTAETAQAFGECLPILSAGDEVGARMACLEVYGRLVAEARRVHRAPQWYASLGYDPERRARAIADGVTRGLLGSSQYPTLPAPRGEAPLLLTGASQSGIPASARSALLALRGWLTKRPAVADSPDAAAKAETLRRAQVAQEAVQRKYPGAMQ